jgi:lipopolysaccharide/colanic/teichoic acid biosynthesis glycosyltransferase
MIYTNTVNSRCMQKLIKYLFDRVFALMGLLLSLPLLVVISGVILLNDGWPVLFVQRRVGKGGKLFPMVKFRTMRLNDGTNTVSVKGDHRITTTGAFLRKYKLDELPGLWNVLIGQMSFVGPRPDVPGYADLLHGADRKILELRPGITGPATLKYANEEELLAGVDDPKRYNDEVIFPDKVKINLEYAHHHNLITDLNIILKTLFKSAKA